MGSIGGFPIDLILFGMIAAFLALRLRSILGRRTGFEQQPLAPQPAAPRKPAGPILEGRAEPPSPPATTRVPDAASPTGQALAGMRTLDPGFDAARFLSGAEQAFRMIVGAFAAGDRATLRPLLGGEIYAAFDHAIAEREKTGAIQVSEIRAIESIGIEDAALRGRIGSVTVRIVSDQVSYTRDSDGRTVSGTDGVTEIIDLWTFERDLSQPDPTWRLVAARSG